VLKNIERIKPADEYFSNPEEIFWLIGTAYSNTHVHYLIFLSEDGNERRYRISDVYPYFYAKDIGSNSLDILRDYGYEGMMPKLRDVELVERRNPMTGDLEKVFKISAKSPNSIINRYSSKSGLNSIFDDKNVFNTKAGYHHQILNETGYIMGMPYTFSEGKPNLYTKGIDEVSHDYIKVFERMTDADLPMGKLAMQMIHAVIPDFSKMIISLDIEIKANMGESMDAELAEVPITSVSVTYKDTNNLIETIVFVLNDVALENIPSPNPKDYEDKSFIRYEFKDERTLLEAAISFVNTLPQKIVLTYNGDGFDIPYISRRLELHNLNLGVKGYKLSDAGQFSRWYKKWDSKYLVDLYQYFGNNNIKTGAYLSEYENLKLNTIADVILGQQKYQYEGRIEDMGMHELAFYNAKDTQLTFDLATHDNNFPSFILFFIMRFGNLTLENANRKGVTAWWSGFEYRHLDQLGFYHPNDSMLDNSETNLKGGFVLPATKGLHYDVSIFDFSSLYPTMVIEHNICYTTMNCIHEECRENKYIVQDRDTHICTKRRGFIPSALSFLRNARIEIYKPKSGESRYYAQLSQFVKIFMNACYGAMANPGFAFMSVPAAMTITQTGRDSLFTLSELIKEENGEVIYGDSIMGTEAVIVRFANEDEPAMILSIQELWDFGYDKGYVSTTRQDGKEQMVVQGLRVWDGMGFNRVYRLIRHYTIKSIYRTSTGTGTVDTTEDHSLVDADGKEFKPEDVSRGRTPVSKVFQFGKYGRLIDKDDISATLLLFLFSMCGTASGTYTGYPSQRTVALHFSSKVRKLAERLFEFTKPAIEAFDAKYKTYATAKDKTVIKFSNHSQLWAFVRRNLYIKDHKLKPLPTVFALPDEYLEMIYEFLKEYYHNDFTDKKGNEWTRWTIKSSSEMMLFTALADKFGDAITVIPQPKGKIYQIRLLRDMSKKTTVSIVRALPDYVYDMETEDGTFMAGNILCHNTDSVFVIGANEGADKRISAKMGIEVENEGHWDMMLQHMKKNYILVNENKQKIKGLRGKKKDVPKMIRKVFADTVKNLKPTMEHNEILDLFTSSVIGGIAKLKAGEFELSDLSRVQTLSKDIHPLDSFGNKCECGNCYKANTPIVTAVKNIMHDLTKAGKDPLFVRSFGRKGVIMEYVRAKDTWKHISTVKKSDADISYYEDVFHKVFNQLTEPLGYELVKYLKTKDQTKLNEWF